MFAFITTKPKKDTKFSEFFREASSREKKKVFKEVIRRAAEEQQEILKRPVKAA